MVATATFVLTLYLVLRRPRGMDTGVAALIGAGVALLLGAVTPADVVGVAAMVWNATLALVGILVVSALLDEAGFFRWAALHLARRAGGSGTALFAMVILFGAVVSGLFTNDSTVLIVTPILYELLLALGFSRRQMLPYLVACGFIADAMSLPLPVSNLTNIIASDFFNLDFGRYVALMALPSLLSLMASLGMLFWLYRRDLPGRCAADGLPEPRTAIRDPFLFRAGLSVLVAIAITFIFGHGLRIPAAAVMGGAAALLLAGTRVRGVIAVGPVLRRTPWTVVLFAAGMYLVVFALGKAGLTAVLSAPIAAWAALGVGPALLGTGTLVAALSAAMNNLPAMLAGSLAIDAVNLSPDLREGLVLAAVIGANIGPKLTPIGSLATLIWLHFLAQKGLALTWRDYLRIGLVITPPVLLASLLGLWAAVALTG